MNQELINIRKEKMDIISQLLVLIKQEYVKDTKSNQMTIKQAIDNSFKRMETLQNFP